MKPNKSITLTWENINAKVKDKQILYDVTGYCKSGEMLAIMGPSGAGKTTLLSLLASKKSSALTISGSVKANNTLFTAQQFYNFGVYIFQNDILHEMLTVKQTLQFIGKLRIKDQNQSTFRVKQMISMFQLQKCQDTFIGGQFKKGISGGQKKRVCIAVEMISNPSLLILDQPTSGLDSNKANTIVKVLRRLAVEQNKTIIFTLHQPSFTIFEKLDRLILLNQGRTIYQGKSSQMFNYLTSKLHITVPLSSTLSDFFMMQISEYKGLKYDHKTQLNHENYCLYLKQRQQVQELQKVKKQIAVEGFDRLQTIRSFGFMFFMLMMRQWTIFKRNPMKGVRVILNSILTVVLAGLIFLNGISQGRPQDNSTIKYNQFDLQVYFIKSQGITFIAIVSCIMSGIFSVSLAFVALVACTLVGNSLGILTGSVFKDAKNASALTPMILLPLMMFAGLYNKLDSIPSWIRWLQYISPFRYGLHSILLDQYGNQQYMTTNNTIFNYRQDLAINIDYQGNIIFLFGLSLLYYGISFIVLKKMSSNLAP